jgi:hypothetical protein
LKEVPQFPDAHGRAVRNAHRKLTQINGFGGIAPFDFGSTSILETL